MVNEQIKDIATDLTKQVATDTLKKPLELLNDIVYHWLKKRFKGTIEKNFLEDAEESAIQNEIQKRLNELAEEIPTNQLITPNRQITTAAMDSMLFCYDDAFMRDMFLRIMLSTVDNVKRKYAHPSFPHILKQLSPIDAQVFAMIRPNTFYNIVNKPNGKCLKVDASKYIVVEGLPNFSSSENTPLSFAVLSMLGLITISDGTTITTTNFSGNNASAVLNPIPSRLKLTPLGILFYKCCLGDE